MNVWMYIAAFLFPLDNFPLMFGQAYKPISLLFIAVYFILNLPYLFRLRYRAIELWIAVIFITIVLYTGFQNVKMHYSFIGLMDAISSLGAGLLVYLSFRIFIYRNNKDASYLKLFKYILRGYGVAIAVGVLQLIYIYAFRSGMISTLIDLFVNRDIYRVANRVHFTFSEPSYIGLHTNLFLIPAYLILKNKNCLSKLDKWIVFSFIPISLFSLSIRYMIDLLVLYIVYVFVTSKAREGFKIIMKLTAMASIIAVLLNVIFVQNIFHLKADHYHRIANMMSNPSIISKDISFSIRSTYSEIGLRAFLDNPMIGYGLGNFYYGYMNHLDMVPPSLLKKGSEFSQATTNLSLPQYNMYTRLLSEFGLIGMLLLMAVAALFHSFKGRNFAKMIMVLLAYSLMQFDSFAFIQLTFWLACFQSGFISQLQLDRSSQKEGGKVPAAFASKPAIIT
ncbi:O-antigen ligase family protein [Paenibacillus solisilvae]|uniref:O-antigen ligase family protein n=1 Tax=Paenibacillus solisilvae TaxID=2486751 RepID=A0ABW0VYX9_9BACL